MRIGSTDEYTIEDLVFHVKRAWGPRQAHQETIRALPPRDDETQAEMYERIGKHDAAAVELVKAVVVNVDGLQDKAGKPMAWSRDLLTELPEPVIEELVQRITFNRSDAVVRADPLASEQSVSPPSAQITPETESSA